MTDNVIERVDYLPEHLDKIMLRPCHDGERPEQLVNNAKTFLLDGEPIAIFVWYFISPQVAHVCGLLSEGITKKNKSFHKAVLDFIDWGFESHKLQRMQMSVLVGFDAGRDWAQSLGFSYEGTMKKYGPDGVDHWLFAKVVG